MSDLISRSAVLTVGNVRKVVEYDDAGYDMTYDAVPVEAIEALPAIDAVPVVRCKDCKWWGLPEGKYATKNVKHCELGRYMVASDGYCVYGEVKSNESE